ncbi:MAG: PSD1 domain-containing protein [Planctomycetaceae bacterium]|nr:PSD1 domain-containing protein [Planctomycetaceae bacterium]
MASSFCSRLVADSFRFGVVIILCFVGLPTVFADDAPVSFFRGLNLNGPSVTIDGQRWEGKDAKNYICKDKAFEAQQVNLLPATDPERALMIRSSRWGGNRIELTEVPDGRYSIFLYAWEDNKPETYDIAVNDQTVVRRHNSGTEGHWERLGPWFTDVKEGKIVLTSQGGAANFSGIEIWRGEYDGSNGVELTEDQLVFFEKRIRPLLVTHCYECHSEKSEEVAGRLLVDSAPTMRRGGDSGPAIVPGDVSHSLLINAVRYEDDNMQMPPDGKLSDAEIASLEEWVRMGAPDPRRSATHIPMKTIDVVKAREFWSFKPITDPIAPTVRDEKLAFNDIDRFVLAALERKGLSPVSTADKRTLIRRAKFDLIGLPPTPTEIDAFLSDESPKAYERLVDRLLTSRQYGERWGRHWMDLVRYADTAGENSDYPIPQVYRYRNYIIDAFNNDKPYDEFLQEQIAGDLLPAENDTERNEHIIATGYIAISRRFGSVIDDYPQHLTIEDTIDNIGRVVMGLTLSCARCHDHKFDPLLQTDYYGIYGMFESTKYAFPGIELDKVPRDFVPLVEDGKPGKEVAYAVVDDKVADAHLQIRGEPKQPGDLVPRKFIDLLGGQRLTDEESKQSGRLQLAQWLTDRENPLTARVMVNRIWQYHFGSGLVKTPSDFGARGQLPTHPELLDWLATRFMESGWSIKQMHRLIMNSRTYQLASTADSIPPSSLSLHPSTIDPNNDLHWRFSRQRLDAESLRDALLMISGELDTSMMTEPHPFPPVDKWQFTQHHPFRDSYDSNRRSVYLMMARLNARPFFTTFDGADRNASTALRDSSVTTVQSLYLLNDDFVHQRSTAFAKRIQSEAESSETRIQLAFESALGREPTNEEQSMAEEFFGQLRDKLEACGTPDSELDRECWTSFARALFRTNEFLYVD